MRNALMLADDLPVILVSAVDAAVADDFISELIDNEVEGAGTGARVWELNNKYYSARVRVCALTDDASVDGGARDPEAHIIYFTESECTQEGTATGAVLARRAAAVRGAGCEVRLALSACANKALPAELRDAARDHRYEVVSTCAGGVAPTAEGPFPELRGLERAREALHAHTWPSLRLHARTPLTLHAPDDDFSPFQSYQNGRRSSGASSASGSPRAPRSPSPEPDEAECARRAELFADVLGALDGVRGTGGAARLVRAEQLVAAFCHALGSDLDRL